MKKIIVVLIVIICSVQVGYTQNYDDATTNKIKVKFFAAEELLENREYSKAIDKVNEIEAITNGPEASVVQNIKVKSYIGLGMYERAKKELNTLYKLSPNDEVLKSIASYESSIDDGIAEEIAGKERARLADIQRKEDAKLAEVRKIEEAKQAEIKREEYLIEQKEIAREYRKYYHKRKARYMNDWHNKNANLILYFGDIDYMWHKEEVQRPYWEAREGGFIDSLGNIVLTKDEIIKNAPKTKLVDHYLSLTQYSYFSEGICSVEIKNKNTGIKKIIGCVDLKGEYTPWEDDYEFASFSYNSYIPVMKDDKWGLINQEGKLIIPLQYNAVLSFSEGLIGVQSEKEGKYGFVNLNNDLVIPYKYIMVTGSGRPYNVFMGGRALVSVKFKKGSFYIDKTGEKL